MLINSQAVQVVRVKVSDRLAEVCPAAGAGDDNGSAVTKPVHTDRAPQSWRCGLVVLNGAEAGDELVSVPHNSVLVASSREELVLAVMEVVQQMRAGTAADKACTRDWRRVVSVASARPVVRLIAGHGLDTVMDALKGGLMRRCLVSNSRKVLLST